MILAAIVILSFPAHRVLPLRAGRPYKAATEKLPKAWNAEKIMPPGGGGYGEMYRRKQSESTAQKKPRGIGPEAAPAYTYRENRFAP